MSQVPFTVPRYCVSIEIDDNTKRKNIVSVGFNTDSITLIEMKLREVAATLDREAQNDN